jgi:hypothetical protein
MEDERSAHLREIETLKVKHAADLAALAKSKDAEIAAVKAMLEETKLASAKEIEALKLRHESELTSARKEVADHAKAERTRMEAE